ncbi:MAG: T9SS type A sorting domain-containing protein [Ignavibacteria bacterium]|nr:T9SS type A sorting domain-containing protein [Ignavibacteria bacterium]
MKKLTSLLVLISIFPFYLNSQFMLEKMNQPVNFLPNIPQVSLNDANYYDSKYEGEQTNLTYRTLTSVVSGRFSLFNMITPFVYEPISKTLILAICNYSSTGQELVGTINLHISTNNGVFWSTKNIFTKAGEVPVLGSLAVVNPEKSSDPGRLSFMVFAPLARRDISGNYPWVGGLFAFSTPQGNESIDAQYPGNLSGYRWWVGRTTAHTTSDGSFAYVVGMLTNQPTTQYGQYGFASFSFADYDFLAEGCPPAWSLSKFRQSTELTSTFNSNMHIEADDAGNVYAAVLNFFQPNVNRGVDRVPGISKSTDYGMTWNDFQPAPVFAFNDYAFSWGGEVNENSGHFPFPYHPNSFIVFGPDNYSFFTRFWILSGNQIRALHLIEANYSGGLWTVTKVADWIGLPLVISDVNIDENVIKDSIYTSFLGHEIQAAKTADGRYVVLKWIDYNQNKLVVLNPPFVISNGEQTLDTLVPTDVFFSYRESNNFYWNQPINATNDTLIDKATWIPKILPSLTQVPLIQLRTQRATNPQHPRYAYPEFVQQYIYDQPQQVIFATVNLTGANVNNFRNKPEYSFYLNEPKPNPAMNEFVEIPFVLDQPMRIKVQIVDALGKAIKVLYEGLATEGVHSVMLNTNELNSGIYFCRLITERGTLSKQLNIIK